ncbi:hypothetical protein ABPG74_007920 [Tetrahymena malaccensis]
MSVNSYKNQKQFSQTPKGTAIQQQRQMFNTSKIDKKQSFGSLVNERKGFSNDKAQTPLWQSQQKYNFASQEGFLSEFKQTHSEFKQGRVQALLQKMATPRVSYQTYKVQLEKANTLGQLQNSLGEFQIINGQTSYEKYIQKKLQSKQGKQEYYNIFSSKNQAAQQKQSLPLQKNKKTHTLSLSMRCSTSFSPNKIYLQQLQQRSIMAQMGYNDFNQIEQVEQQLRVSSFGNNNNNNNNNTPKGMSLTQSTEQLAQNKNKFINIGYMQSNSKFSKGSSQMSNFNSYKSTSPHLVGLNGQVSQAGGQIPDLQAKTTYNSLYQSRQSLQVKRSPRKKISLIELAQNQSSFEDFNKLAYDDQNEIKLNDFQEADTTQKQQPGLFKRTSARHSTLNYISNDINDTDQEQSPRVVNHNHGQIYQERDIYQIPKRVSRTMQNIPYPQIKINTEENINNTSRKDQSSFQQNGEDLRISQVVYLDKNRNSPSNSDMFDIQTLRQSNSTQSNNNNVTNKIQFFRNDSNKYVLQSDSLNPDDVKRPKTSQENQEFVNPQIAGIQNQFQQLQNSGSSDRWKLNNFITKNQQKVQKSNYLEKLPMPKLTLNSSKNIKTPQHSQQLLSSPRKMLGSTASNAEDLQQSGNLQISQFNASNGFHSSNSHHSQQKYILNTPNSLEKQSSQMSNSQQGQGHHNQQQLGLEKQHSNRKLTNFNLKLGEHLINSQLLGAGNNSQISPKKSIIKTTSTNKLGGLSISNLPIGRGSISQQQLMVPDKKKFAQNSNREEGNSNIIDERRGSKRLSEIFKVTPKNNNSMTSIFTASRTSFNKLPDEENKDEQNIKSFQDQDQAEQNKKTLHSMLEGDDTKPGVLVEFMRNHLRDMLKEDMELRILVSLT